MQRPGRFTPGKTWYPMCRRLGGLRAGVGGCGKSRPPRGFDPRTVKPVASRYTDWATAAYNSTLLTTKVLKPSVGLRTKQCEIRVPVFSQDKVFVSQAEEDSYRKSVNSLFCLCDNYRCSLWGTKYIFIHNSDEGFQREKEGDMLKIMKRNCQFWDSLTTAWRVLRLRMEERPPKRRLAANILNKQSRTTDKWWSSSLGCWVRC